MNKREFKQILKEATNYAISLYYDSSYFTKPIAQRLYDMFDHRIEEAMEVILEHKVWGVDKSDPDLHAYWKKAHSAYCAAFKIGYVRRQMDYFSELYKEYEAEVKNGNL